MIKTTVPAGGLRKLSLIHILCGRITPGKRLAVILVMFFLFGGLSIYITVSSIYNIGTRAGQRLQIEHIKQYPLHDSDSINPLNLSLIHI